jgi:hypothetical protein
VTLLQALYLKLASTLTTYRRPRRFRRIPSYFDMPEHPFRFVSRRGRLLVELCPRRSLVNRLGLRLAAVLRRTVAA